MLRNTVFLLVLLSSISAIADETHIARFEESARPKNWSVNTGYWEPKEGVLVCRELEADQHAAASRWQVPLSDGVITCRLKFAGAKGFHIGFDPAVGQLDKKGHLYSLVILPQSVSIKKHKDKADEKSKDETLGTAKFEPGSDWIDIELQTAGDDVVATLKQGAKQVEVKGHDASFHVAKPTVVFRAMGGDALLDDVQVKVTKSGLK